VTEQRLHPASQNRSMLIPSQEEQYGNRGSTGVRLPKQSLKVRDLGGHFRWG